MILRQVWKLDFLNQIKYSIIFVGSYMKEVRISLWDESNMLSSRHLEPDPWLESPWLAKKQFSSSQHMGLKG